MKFTPPADEFENIARLWQAHDSIIVACEGLAKQYGLDPVLAENLIEDLREADNFAEDSETWNRALARMFEALLPPRDD